MNPQLRFAFAPELVVDLFAGGGGASEGIRQVVHGEEYRITDIGMRMLQPHELFRAQGFPESYQITHGHDGRRFTKTKQVRCCGNSVCPPLARAIVAANVGALVEMEQREKAA